MEKQTQWMKAAVYQQYGPPQVLRIETRPRPSPAKNEVLIRVKAVEVTKSDCELRRCRFAVKWFWLPIRLALGILRPRRQILGSYFSGEIVALGQGVKNYRIGQSVFGSAQLRMGAYAEYLCVPASFTLVELPQNLDYGDAASVILGGFNALHFLRRAQLQPGESLLINGAGGSIGLAAVQIAHSMGAVVTAVDKSEKATLVRRAGAKHFIDYQQTPLEEIGSKFDVIFDMVANSDYNVLIRLLNPEGRYVLGNPRFINMIRSVITPVFTDKSVIFAFARETVEELNTLIQMLQTGQLVAIIDKRFPLESIVEAHELVEREERLGSVVIQMEAPLNR